MKSSRSKNAPSGWTFTSLYDGVWNHAKYGRRCSRANNNWFGYCGGGCAGSIKTKLSKCGKARLNFGNCCSDSNGNVWSNSGDTVVAKLNGREIGTAQAYHSKVVEFDFKNGDTLVLRERDSIIEFNDFTIISCSAC